MENKNNKDNSVIIVIAVIAIAGLLFMTFIGTIVFLNISYNKKIKDASSGIINKSKDIMEDGYDFIEKNEFNSELEDYSGIQEKSDVMDIIDTIATLNGQNLKHQVKLIFDNNYYVTTYEMVELEKNLTDSKYIVAFDYDKDGYIDTVRIDTVNNDTINSNT